jgi:hypothetical protein
MSLTDPEMAQLAQDAADSVELGLSVRIAPAPNNDPYRWGSPGWTVTVDKRPAVRVWIPADASPKWAFEEIARRIKSETVG